MSRTPPDKCTKAHIQVTEPTLAGQVARWKAAIG
jgi:hypothetical protein